MSLCLIERTVACSREVDIQRLDVIRVLALELLELVLHADIDITDLLGLVEFFLELNNLLLTLVDPQKSLVCLIV